MYTQIGSISNAYFNTLLALSSKVSALREDSYRAPAQTHKYNENQLCISFAFDVHKVFLDSLGASLNDQSGQLATFETISVNAIGVLGLLQTAFRVMAVNDGGAFRFRDGGLIAGPYLDDRNQHLLRCMLLCDEVTYPAPVGTIPTVIRDPMMKINRPHVHDVPWILMLQLDSWQDACVHNQ